MPIRIDHGDFDEWAQSIEDAIARAPAEAAKVLGRGALNIKKDAQRTVRRKLRGRRSHLRRYPYSIGYDVYQGLRGPTADIGPDKNKTRLQGPFGAIVENGSLTSAPMPHMRPAGEREAPKFAAALEDLAAKLLEQR
ncbi:hypothetical protein [Micromonospora okii]|uniref:hypothetical protein n=1 Tax=Micromonospora okii TaxID=1182970 RepID=UPI001E3A24DB|nr:hypothetical protein [Micromonospora okii]